MRFVAKSAGYSITYKHDIVANFATGESQILQPLWNCQFKTVGIKAAEIAQAKLWAVNHGMPVEEDSVTPVDPGYRFGVFDTEEFQAEHAADIFERCPNGFDDGERRKLEEFLLAHQDEYYRVVEVVKLAAPWPNYDTFKGVRGEPTGPRIAARVLEDGYDIDAVLAYEKENRNRQDVLDALEALRAEPAVDDSLLVSA